MLNRETRAAITGTVVGAIIGGIIAFFTMYTTEYIHYELEKGRQIETAYFQVLLAKQTIDTISPNKKVLPLNKLLFDDTDWNVVLGELQDSDAGQTYVKLRRLDDIRNKIFETTDRKEKVELTEEFYKTISNLQMSGNLDKMVEELNSQRLSVKLSNQVKN